jgi:hypothetical protein
MKARRVLITIEMTSEHTLKEIKDDYLHCYKWNTDKFHRVTVKVVKEEKGLHG